MAAQRHVGKRFDLHFVTMHKYDTEKVKIWGSIFIHKMDKNFPGMKYVSNEEFLTKYVNDEEMEVSHDSEQMFKFLIWHYSHLVE